MTLLRLKYLKVYRDRHGNVRRYFRRRGQKDLPLKGEPGTPEFMLAYQAATGATAPAVDETKLGPSRGSSLTTAGPRLSPISSRRRRSYTGSCLIASPSGMGIALFGTQGAATPGKWSRKLGPPNRPWQTSPGPCCGC